VNLWRDYYRTTNKADVGAESMLEDHGLDSLDSIELSMKVEEDLGYKFFQITAQWAGYWGFLYFG
jgi:hypothetical protein